MVLGGAVVAYASIKQSDMMWLTLALGVLFLVTGSLALRSSHLRFRSSGVRARSLAPVSTEGQRLLHKLCSHIGYYNYQDEPYGRSLGGLRGFRTTCQVLPQELFELLNGAAHQHNRIEGLLMERASATDGSLKAIEPNVRAAAIEAMALIVNHAAWIDTFPENAQDHAQTIRARSAQLQELADRVSKLVRAKPSVVESLGARTLMDDVLDRLRLDDDARGELTALVETEWEPQRGQDLNRH